MTKKDTLSARNKRFWAMTDKQKRVAIAKDIITQIKSGFYNPKISTYFSISMNGSIEKQEVPKQLDKTLNKIKQIGGTCNVCQLGACFASLVRLGNKCETDDFISGYISISNGYSIVNQYEMRSRLKKVFSDQQISLIECAFEGGISFDRNHNTPIEQRVKAKEFGVGYISSDTRMIAICKNIIKNEGTFKP